MRAALALLVTGGIAVAAGVLGFQAGVASNIGAAGGSVVLGGFSFVGPLLFMGFLFFSFLALAAIFSGRRHRHGAWGHHAMGPGGFGPGGPGGGQSGDPRRAWVAEIHRSLHEEDAQAAGPTGPTSTGP
jgi:hypothetical protein